MFTAVITKRSLVIVAMVEYTLQCFFFLTMYNYMVGFDEKILCRRTRQGSGFEESSHVYRVLIF